MALDLARLRVFPLATRESFSRVDEILIDPERPPGSCPREAEAVIELAAQKIQAARAANAAVMLLFGAHLIRNGAALLMIEMMARRWVTHLATNGAGSIHDWEYAFAGRSTESVRANVA